MGLLTMAENNRGFGDLLIKWQGDMTDAELMSRAGISRNQIYLLKTGRSGTRRDTIDRLAKALHIFKGEDVAEFYAAAGFTPPPAKCKDLPTAELTYESDPDAEEAMSYYMGLPPPLKKAANRTLP